MPDLNSSEADCIAKEVGSCDRGRCGMIGFARVGTLCWGPREAGQEGLRKTESDSVVDWTFSFSPRAPGAEVGSGMEALFKEADEFARWAAKCARCADVASEALRATPCARPPLRGVATAFRLGTSMWGGSTGCVFAKPFFSFSL